MVNLIHSLLSQTLKTTDGDEQCYEGPKGGLMLNADLHTFGATAVCL